MTLLVTVVTSYLTNVLLLGTPLILLLLLCIPIASGLRCVNARGRNIRILLVLAPLPLLLI